MDCTVIADDLLAYEMDLLPEERRAAVEEHLTGCASCVRSFFALRRQLAHAAKRTERPSPAARARLRASVEASFRPSLPRRLGRLLARPVPLYQGLAAAFALVLVTFALRSSLPLAGRLRAHPSLPGYVDSSRPAVDPFTVY